MPTSADPQAPKPRLHVIRRLLARAFDIVAYCLLSIPAVMLLQGTMPAKAEGLFAILVMVVGNALLTWLAGTTPGKWALGMRVRHVSGRRLNPLESLSREGTVLVVIGGGGFPAIGLLAIADGYAKLTEEAVTPWDNVARSALDYGKLRAWNYLIVAAGVAIFLLALVLGPEAPR